MEELYKFDCTRCGRKTLISPHDENWHETGLDEAVLEYECPCGLVTEFERTTEYTIGEV